MSFFVTSVPVSPMHAIHSVEDLRLYEGQIVAFEIDYGPINDIATLVNGVFFGKFGRIREENDKWRADISIQVLTESSDYFKNFFLLKDPIYYPFYVRCASSVEIAEIRGLTSTGLAVMEFDNIFAPK